MTPTIKVAPAFQAVVLIGMLMSACSAASEPIATDHRDGSVGTGVTTNDSGSASPCMMTLASLCADPSATEVAPCVPTFDAAKLCSSWPGSSAIRLADSCAGFRVVYASVVDRSTIYFYDQASGALVAMGDADHFSTGVDCWAGPIGSTLPSECLNPGDLYGCTPSPVDAGAE